MKVKGVSLATQEVLRTMSGETLFLLREMFKLDADEAARVSTVAFCEQRMALIDQILAERETMNRR